MESLFFHPLGNKNIVILLLSELAKCFDSEINKYRKIELRTLIKMLAIL